MYIPKLPLGARGYHSCFVFRICDHEHNENQIPRRKKNHISTSLIFVSAKIKQKNGKIPITDKLRKNILNSSGNVCVVTKIAISSL